MRLEEKNFMYSQYMEEVEKRVDVLEQLLKRDIPTPYLIINVEFSCVQIRKILELIALSSVVANKKEYQAVKNRLEKLWNAKEVLKDLKVINPKFYPEPIVLQMFNGDPNNTRTQPVKDGYLTIEEFKDVYSRCGGMLHAQNPFAEAKQFSQISKAIPCWIKKIKKLVDKHVVNLVDENTMIMVIMNSDYDAKVAIGVYSRKNN